MFRANGFYLNGKKTFLRGLNRHQSYPYIGYAAPESLQRQDARILKNELHCNAVRTSHYPQSQYFLDECDRLGLLVFTELPGWQHIGDGAWKDRACAMPTKSPTHWTRAGRPLACGFWKRAISWKMFTPTTISPTTAQTPGPSGKRM